MKGHKQVFAYATFESSAMEENQMQEMIVKVQTALGIEFGSTRIKAVLIDENYEPIAIGTHERLNRYENLIRRMNC